MRKSAMVDDDTKNALNTLKDNLNLKNDNDIIMFLMSVYVYSENVPKESLELLIDLHQNSMNLSNKTIDLIIQDQKK